MLRQDDNPVSYLWINFIVLLKRGIIVNIRPEVDILANERVERKVSVGDEKDWIHRCRENGTGND
jgi:hypothetical protein